MIRVFCYPPPQKLDFVIHKRRTLLSLVLAALIGALSLFAAAPAEAQTIPTKPRNVQVAPGNAKLTLTWEAPLSWGSGLPPHRYEIDWSVGASAPEDNSLDWEAIMPDLAASATSYTLTGTYAVRNGRFHMVANGIKYWFRIRAFSIHPIDSTDTVPGNYVKVSGTPVAQQTPTQSTDATLSALTASTSTSASGTFTALTLSPSTFAAATTAYTATVANTVTHVKITPTTNDSNATVEVGKGSSLTAVTSGNASGPISLSVGANAITVKVTAQDSSTTKTYTVTVTRPPPTVSLSASPNPVTEGSSVTVTATLARALSSSVTIPVTLTAVTAESGDYGTLTSISIAASATSGTGTVSTNQDADKDDETFTVSLGTLPSSVTVGTPSSVTITIWDADKPYRLSVEASPPCGTTVTDMSVAASTVLVLTPAPAAEAETQYRWVTETSAGAWRGALSIRSESEEFNPGRGTRSPHSTFAELRQAFPGFSGFEFRLRDNHGTTASCTWQFDDGGGGPPPARQPTTPTTPTNQSPSNTDRTGGGGGGGGPALSGDASLSALEIPGISPDFDTDTETYTVSAYDRDSVTVTPTASDDGAEITVNGNTVQNGSSAVVTLDEDGETIIKIVVTAEDGTTTRTYEITVTRCGAERENLVRFYEASGGEDWSDNENWNSEEPPGQWFGVRTDEDGSVISLRLTDNGLSGETPRELLCLSELKELALWDNDGLSGEVPQELALAVERAALRDVAAALSLNAVWFDTYEDPYGFGDWHEGVTTDDDGRVTELDFSDGEEIEGTIPVVLLEQLGRLETLYVNCTISVEGDAPAGVSVMMADDCPEEEAPPETASSGGGGCALTSEDDSSAFGLFLLALLVFAALGRTRARG